MNTEQALLQAIHEVPADETVWHALADCLEEAGDPRAEAVRLCQKLRAEPGQPDHEARLREMLAAGQGPPVPSRVNSLRMRFALLPSGRFLMGGEKNEDYCSADERPRHAVTLPRPFYLGAHQVTQRQFQRVMGRNPSYFSAEGGGRDRVAGVDTAHFPVEHVTWEDAAAFCEALSQRPAERKRGHTYRLPTEAEWEYGCRGLMSAPTSFGASLSTRQANFDGNYPFGQVEAGPYLERPAPVGSYPANVFGLFDMHGNVWEWCQDWYGGSVYRERNRVGPVGPATGQEKVQRGGSWYSYGWACRASERCRAFPNTANERTGFRVVLVVA